MELGINWSPRVQHIARDHRFLPPPGLLALRETAHHTIPTQPVTDPTDRVQPCLRVPPYAFHQKIGKVDLDLDLGLGTRTWTATPFISLCQSTSSAAGPGLVSPHAKAHKTGLESLLACEHPPPTLCSS